MLFEGLTSQVSNTKKRIRGVIFRGPLGAYFIKRRYIGHCYCDTFIFWCQAATAMKGTYSHGHGVVSALVSCVV